MRFPVKIIFCLLIAAAALIEVAAQSSSTKTPSYIGCWSGMHGGQLKITRSKVYDLATKESSAYKTRFISRRTPTGIATGEDYLLQAGKDFPKSFLAKFIKLAFNRDETVGFITYESYRNFLNDKYVGMGLFQKISCKPFAPSVRVN